MKLRKMLLSNKKRVLVTGGGGFLGSHLCERLLRDGCHVVCVDNFYSSAQENISHLIGRPDFQLIKHDIALPLYVDTDEIYNLACPASPVNYQRDPIQTMKTSVLGAINMLELAKGIGARILQASTSEVYGDPQVHPQAESYWGHVNPVGVRACYDEGKRCAETLFFDYQRKYDIEIRVVRIFNTYGPRMRPDDGRVVSNFVFQALTNQDITIYGDGHQTRSFQFVDDLIEGMVKMMGNSESFFGPVNLGNPSEFTIKELAEQILKLIPESASKIVYKPLPSDDPVRRKPDINLASKKLGWAPTVHLEEGLNKTIAHFRDDMSARAGAPPATC